MNKIAVLGSGGDAPGMNPCIRAVTRSALERGLEVWGVWDGYNGLVDRRIEQLTSRGVAGILQRGGSMIGAGRCPAFFDAATRQACADYLRGEGIEGLVVMGGDGSMNGARELHLLGVPTVVVPVTIDNDMRGTEITVGADTAINTAVEAIDRLRDTASAHQRAMIVEVMGRHSGYIAMMAGIATGAEMIITPERASELESIFAEMRDMDARGKRHFIVVIAEGARWSAAQLTELINEAPNPTTLGTRSWATSSAAACRAGSTASSPRAWGSRPPRRWLEGRSNVLVGWRHNQVAIEDIDHLAPVPDPWSEELWRVYRVTTT